RDRSLAVDVDREPAEEVQDADAALEPFAADADELGGRALKPRCHHEAVVVPHGGEALPVTRVAPQDPVLDQLADQQTVVGHTAVDSGGPGIWLVGGIGGPLASPVMSGVP